MYFWCVVCELIDIQPERSSKITNFFVLKYKKELHIYQISELSSNLLNENAMKLAGITTHK